MHVRVMTRLRVASFRTYSFPIEAGTTKPAAPPGTPVLPLPLALLTNPLLMLSELRVVPATNDCRMSSDVTHEKMRRDGCCPMSCEVASKPGMIGAITTHGGQIHSVRQNPVLSAYATYLDTSSITAKCTSTRLNWIQRGREFHNCSSALYGAGLSSPGMGTHTTPELVGIDRSLVVLLY